MASKVLSTNTLTRGLSNLFRKFHLTLFFVCIIAILVGAVIMLNKTLTDSVSESGNYTSSISAGSIDEATLQRLQTLRTSDQPAPGLTLPDGRINPFAE